MTILDRETTSKTKDETVLRQTNQEKANWSQRSRQNHSQRNRVSGLHRREQQQQVVGNGDFSYWNEPAIQRSNRKESTHCEANSSHHHEKSRDDSASRSHLKPKGLSKSSSTTGLNEDMLTSINKDTIHSTLEAPNILAKGHDVSVPTTSNPSKIVARNGKKNGDKKLIHGKRKHRRSAPYNHSTSKSAKHIVKSNCTIFPPKLPQPTVDDSPTVGSNTVQNAICQYPGGALLPNESRFTDAEAVYNSCHFPGESPNFIHNLSRQEDYSNLPVLHNTSCDKNPLGEDCRTISSFSNEKSENEINEARHNSDDEYDQTRLKRLNHGIDYKEREEEFEEKLKKIRGFIIKPMLEDGACLFRAVADQIYGDQDMHDEVRKNCMNYMMKNADYYSNYITEDFETYISRKKELDTFGNHLEMQAMAELYNRPFEVYQYTTEPINTFQTSHLSANPPIRVSYHENSHYNSVIDPYKATIGVGLGLPSFKPGLVENSMLKEAMKASEDVWEQQMLNDKVVATDWETTDDAILEQVARESYMEYIEQKTSKIKEVEVKHSEPKKTPPHELRPPTEESSAKTYSPKIVVKEFPKKNNRSLRHSGGDWVAEDEEWAVLSQVLANSQQEYMDVLKQHATQSKATCSKYT